MESIFTTFTSAPYLVILFSAELHTEDTLGIPSYYTPTANIRGREEMLGTGSVRFKGFPCPYCDHKSNRKGDLERHIMRHTGEKPFKCPHCPQAYTRRKILRIHVYRMHKDLSDLNV